MKTLQNKMPILKKSIPYSLFMAVLIVLGSCKKDDAPEQKPIPEITGTVTPEPEVTEKTIFGDWEITSGKLATKNSKFVHINEDNTINILSEDSRGFKQDYTTNITVSENQLTISRDFGTQINNYVLDEDSLTIMAPGESEVKLSRSSSIPEVTDWIKVLSILDEGDAPWEGRVDIAYNGSQILYGIENGGDQIGLINPSTFNLAATIPTTRSAYAVEVEKYEGPGSRYIFQSNNGHTKFFAYNELGNTQAFESIDTGAWINGLASVDETRIWVASGNESALYLYQYSGADEIISTIELDFQPYGLDYQNGFLYISDGLRIHKCDLSADLRAVESYRIPNHRAFGIAFDGTNFWLSTYSSDAYKLIKVNLSL